MNVYLELDWYWVTVGTICITLAGFWAIRRLKSLF